jgi:TonB family protein
MRIVLVTICAVLLGASCSAIAQNSNDPSTTPPEQESPQKPPCKQRKLPKVVFNPPASPPDSWVGKGPKSAMTRLELTVDKKGRVKNLAVVQSSGKDVDRQAMEAVRQWRFTPAMCDTDPFEVKIQVEVEISLR